MLIFPVNSGLFPFGHIHAVLLQKLFIKVLTFHFGAHLENRYCCRWWLLLFGFDLGNAIQSMLKLCPLPGVCSQTKIPRHFRRKISHFTPTFSHTKVQPEIMQAELKPLKEALPHRAWSQPEEYSHRVHRFDFWKGWIILWPIIIFLVMHAKWGIIGFPAS